MSVTFDPKVTTVASGTFLKDTQGYVSGFFLDDPGLRYQLEGGVVDAAQTTPPFLWGGLPIQLTIPDPDVQQLGPAMELAANNAAIVGWTAFNMSAAGIITPSSAVPQYSAGTSLNFVRKGSNLRLVLPCDPTLAAALVGDPQTQQVSWDFTNQLVIAFSGGIGALPITAIEFVDTNSKAVVYTSGSKTAAWEPGQSVVVVRV